MKKGRGRGEYYEDEYNEEDGGGVGGEGSSGGKRMRRIDGGVDGGYGYGSGGKAGSSGQLENKGYGRARIERDADNQQLLELEEKDAVSSLAIVLSDLCGPEDWMPMEKLHAELSEQFGNIWHHSRVRKYLTSEDICSPEAKGKPWYGILMLLRKYPKHFVIILNPRDASPRSLCRSSPYHPRPALNCQSLSLSYIFWPCMIVSILCMHA